MAKGTALPEPFVGIAIGISDMAVLLIAISGEGGDPPPVPPPLPLPAGGEANPYSVYVVIFVLFA